MLNWSQEWKLNPNADKTEVCPFSPWSNKNIWQPTLFMGNWKTWVNFNPNFLSVTLDRTLRFNAHLKKLTASLSSSLHIIKTTAHASWGWRCSTLNIAFTALISSNLQSYHTCSNQLILKAQEEALHSTDDHSKLVALAADIPQRFKNCCSFCRKANDISTLLPAELEIVNPSTVFHLHHAVKHPCQGANFHLCFWYHWLSWWHWSKTLMQSETHCIILSWLHHLH